MEDGADLLALFMIGVALAISVLSFLIALLT